MKKETSLPKAILQVPKPSKSHTGVAGGFFKGTTDFVIVAKSAAQLKRLAVRLDLVLNPDDVDVLVFNHVAIFGIKNTVRVVK